MKYNFMFTRSHFVILLCSMGGHAINMIPFSYGIIQPYIFSYLKSMDPSITIDKMHVHAPLCLIAATGTAWTFGIFERYVPASLLHIANSLLLVGWTGAMYFFLHSYAAITVAIALIGFHCGQLHVFFCQRVTEEGKHHSATANGVYGFLFGLAGIWGNIMGSLYINPWGIAATVTTVNNHTIYVFTAQSILDKVRPTWIILSGVMLLLLLPGCCVVGFKPVQSKGLSTGDESEMLLEEDEAEGEEKVFSLTGLTLFLTTVGIGVSSMCAFDLFKDFGLKKINDDSFLNLAGTLIPIVGAVGRIGWGMLGDCVSLKPLFICANLLTAILQVLMFVSRVDKHLYVTVVCLLAIMPGIMTLLPPAVKKYMGNTDIGLKYGLILTGEVLGCVYYIAMAAIFRKYISDLLLVCVLGIPVLLALIPTVLVLKYKSESTVTRSGQHNYSTI